MGEGDGRHAETPSIGVWLGEDDDELPDNDDALNHYTVGNNSSASSSSHITESSSHITESSKVHVAPGLKESQNEPQNVAHNYTVPEERLPIQPKDSLHVGYHHTPVPEQLYEQQVVYVPPPAPRPHVHYQGPGAPWNDWNPPLRFSNIDVAPLTGTVSAELCDEEVAPSNRYRCFDCSPNCPDKSQRKSPAGSINAQSGHDGSPNESRNDSGQALPQVSRDPFPSWVQLLQQHHEQAVETLGRQPELEELESVAQGAVQQARQSHNHSNPSNASTKRVLL